VLNSNISSTCPHNMANFSAVAAEIGSVVWGTPANFNGFRVLASLLQRRRSPQPNQSLYDVWPSPWRGTRNGITELSQMAPPIFGWAAITLGIDPHSSYISRESQTTRNVLWSRGLCSCLSAVACPHYCMDPGVTWGSGRRCTLDGFAIGARVALLWQHNANARS